MTTIFEEYDLVYHYKYGQGVVISIPSESWMEDKITISFKKETFHRDMKTDLISFTSYTLEKGGFSKDTKYKVKSYDFKTDYFIKLENKMKNIK